MTKNKYQKKKTNKKQRKKNRHSHIQDTNMPVNTQSGTNVESTLIQRFFQRCVPDGIPAIGSQRIISNHGVLKDFNGLIRHYIRPCIDRLL